MKKPGVKNLAISCLLWFPTDWSELFCQRGRLSAM